MGKWLDLYLVHVVIRQMQTAYCSLICPGMTSHHQLSTVRPGLALPLRLVDMATTMARARDVRAPDR